MAFTIHAFRDGHFVKTLRLQLDAAAERARSLQNQGWRVHVTDEEGRRYPFDVLDELKLSEHRPSLPDDNREEASQ